MTTHATVIVAGPASVYRSCCAAAPAEPHQRTALECIDDPVALLDGQPIDIATLWSEMLRSPPCPGSGPDRPPALVIHPAWWSATRVELVCAAARVSAGAVLARSRFALMCSEAPEGRYRVLIEIADQLVAVTAARDGNDAETTAEPRWGPPDQVAEAVARRVGAAICGAEATVWIDGPGGVGGATALAAMIGERLRGSAAGVLIVDESRWSGLAAAALPPLTGGSDPPVSAAARGPDRMLLGCGALLSAVALLSAAVVYSGREHRAAPPTTDSTPTTFLVEGRIAVEVPAEWPVRRVTAGPGSARVEVISPSDPETVLQVTQALVLDPDSAAESLEQAFHAANSAAASPVFVDFDPAGVSAGRPALTYREIRASHHVAWTVLIDDTVRIGIGCQSRPGAVQAVRSVCDRAVRSAHTLR